MKIIRKLILFILISSICLCSVSCGPSKDPKIEKQKYSCDIWDAFDTVITVMAYCENEDEFKEIETVSKELFVKYHRLYDIYNDYDGINNIKSVNDNAGVAPVKVSKEILDLLKLGKDLYEKSAGDVNIAFGSVLKIWHVAREISEADPSKAYVPDTEELKKASLHCNIEDVVIDEAGSTVFLKDPEMSLDVGAIAKGYAAELVADELRERGFDCFLITAGTSSIKAVGRKPDGSSWTSAVETDPDMSIIEISDHSITTSGIYQRYYEVDGRTYHHIINKDTLMPENNYISVTLITDDCGYGDGLATAVFNMSPEDGLEFVNGQSGVYGMWVFTDGSKVCSDGFKDFLR